MKKVAILTINDDYNYGNRLQNYALQEFLKMNNIIPETINNQENLYNRNYIRRLKRFAGIVYKKFISKNNLHKRYINFLKFNRRIKYSNYLIDTKHIPKNINKKYDYFITGSDQVWNPNFDRLSNVDLLEFAENNKKISFSASFAVSELPKEYEEKAKKELKTFKAISVRENTAKEIVQKLTNRNDIEVLLDPTMLLDIEKWDMVIKKPKQLETDKYILNYFLGDLSEKRKKEIERIAKENNCEVINILDKKRSILFLWTR